MPARVVACPVCQASRPLEAGVSADQPFQCSHCGSLFPVDVAADDTQSGSQLPAEQATQDFSPNPSPVGGEEQIAFAFLHPPREPDELGRLGPYRVVKKLGQGGMGMVFQAEDIQLQRQVALKVMLPRFAADAQASQRFLREARAAAAIKSDHIVTIFQVGEDGGVPFLAMEFLEGQPLNARLKREGKLPVAEVSRIGREIAEGLAAAHERGLIHRDIKPANLWLEGKKGRVKILDFGLARSVKDELQLTQNGAILGTPAYMAPEQARGGKVDGRCDLFSLGCVLYEMATGTRAFQGPDTLALLMALAVHNPPSPSRLNPSIPSALCSLIDRLLAKDPARRPESAHDVVDMLQALIEPESPSKSRSDNTPPCHPGPATTAAGIVGTKEDAGAKLPRTKGEIRQSVPSAADKGLAGESKKTTVLALAAAACALTLMAAAAVYYLRPPRESKDDRVTERGPPWGDGVKNVSAPPPPDKKVHPAGLDRRVAERLVKVANSYFEIEFDQDSKRLAITAGQMVPDLPFHITDVDTYGVTDADLEQMAGLERCWRLSLKDGAFTHNGIAHLRNSKSLRSLGFRSPQITDDVLEQIGCMTELTAFVCWESALTDRGASHLRNLKSLKMLLITNSEISDAGLASLAGLEQLEQLSLTRSRINGKGLKHLAGLTRVGSLDLSFNDLAHADFGDLQPMEGLLNLTLNGTQMPATSLKTLANAGRITELNLRFGKNITAETLQFVAAIPKLSCLNLSDSDVTNDSLKPIQDAKKLTGLLLANTAISDAGLHHLHGTQLKDIDISNTTVSDAGKDRLQEALPECRVRLERTR